MRHPAAVLLAAAALAAVAAVAVLAGTAPAAGAASDGGASTRVGRDGRITTWILLPQRRSSGAGSPATEVWVTLGPAEVDFLVHLAAARPDLADDPVLAALAAAAGDGLPAEVDLQVLVRGGRPTTQVRTVPAPPGTAAGLARRMVTVLPALAPTVSPPPAATVPVGTPVFVSFPAAEWGRRVDRTLTAGGVTARVRAWPEAVRLSSGDPADVGRVVTCQGPGRPFDATDPASPTSQAARPGACTTTYRTTTGTGGRRSEWFGDVVVLWRAEWTTDGSTWRPLGLVPRLSVLQRRVSGMGTAVALPPGP